MPTREHELEHEPAREPAHAPVPDPGRGPRSPLSRLLDRLPNKRAALARSLAGLGLLRLLEGVSRARPAAFLVLTYHRIAEPGAAGNPYYDPVVSATPEGFEAQLRALARRYRFLALEELIDHAGAVRTPPSAGKPALLITFDDAYRDNAETALPILGRLGVPAAFFVPTAILEAPRLPWWDHVALVLKETRASRIVVRRGPGDEREMTLEVGPAPEGGGGNRAAAIGRVIGLFLRDEVPDEAWFLRHLEEQAGVAVDSAARGRALFMSREQLVALAGAGMSVGSHGHRHLALARLDDEGQRAELTASKRRLEALLGREITALAYPFGWPGAFTARTAALAAEAGYRLAFTAIEGVNRPGRPGFAPFALRRLNVGTGDTPDLLRARAALHSALGRSATGGLAGPRPAGERASG